MLFICIKVVFNSNINYYINIYLLNDCVFIYSNIYVKNCVNFI